MVYSTLKFDLVRPSKAILRSFREDMALLAARRQCVVGLRV